MKNKCLAYLKKINAERDTINPYDCLFCGVDFYHADIGGCTLSSIFRDFKDEMVGSTQKRDGTGNVNI